MIAMIANSEEPEDESKPFVNLGNLGNLGNS
jgi:hypothetical protein